jgi:hypothetical protein
MLGYTLFTGVFGRAAAAAFATADLGQVIFVFTPLMAQLRRSPEGGKAWPALPPRKSGEGRLDAEEPELMPDARTLEGVGDGQAFDYVAGACRAAGVEEDAHLSVFKVGERICDQNNVSYRATWHRHRLQYYSRFVQENQLLPSARTRRLLIPPILFLSWIPGSK